MRQRIPKALFTLPRWGLNHAIIIPSLPDTPAPQTHTHKNAGPSTLLYCFTSYTNAMTTFLIDKKHCYNVFVCN